jgi:hypothetical protein
MTEEVQDKEIPAIDPTVVETMKFRPNGMVRYAREWVPMSKDLPEVIKQGLWDYLQSRRYVPYKFPVAQSYYRSRYGDLSDEQISALDDYMTGHGQVGLSGDDLFWVFEIKMEDLKTYIGEVAVKQGYESFDHYHSWYKENVLSKEADRGRPEGSESVWPIILDSYAGEGIQDGLHRFHQYVDAGIEVVPALAFVDEYAYLDNVLKTLVF